MGADIGGIYDWDLETVPQTQLDGNTRPMPQGKVLGGGSILNAMCWNRGGSDDFDAWEAFGNPGWGWAGILPYFMKVSHSCSFPHCNLTHALERDIYPCVLRRDCRRVFDSLQPCCSWNIWSCAGQLSQVLLSSIQYVLLLVRSRSRCI